MKRLTLLIFLSLLFIQQALAQDKYEKESRIKRAEVPEKAVRFIDSAKLTKKLKWYEEQGLRLTTYEVKTCHNKSKYSIEFDASGSIEDIEIDRKWNEIPADTQSIINSFLDSIYQKKKIRKVQIQFTGSSDELHKMLTQPNSTVTVTTKYEIVVKGKKNNEYEMVEYLFSDNGKMERRSKIILKNTDNLEY